MSSATLTRRVYGGDDATTADFKMCRTVLHAWEFFNPLGMPEPLPGRYRFSFRCVRCNTERHDQINIRTHALESREYRYPDGYQLEKGVERPSREDWRGELFDSMRAKLLEEHAIAVEVATRSAARRKSKAA
jgi:hypothetical protein